MKHALLCLALAALAPAPRTQTTFAQDVGLTLDFGPLLPAFAGYACGPFSCAPIGAGNWSPGATRTFIGYAAYGAPWALLVGLPGSCQPVPGIANALIPAPPWIVLHAGVTGPWVSTAACKQGAERVPLTLPKAVPIGLGLSFQNAGVSASTGGLAFGPALDVTVQ